jgi:hypothetical protein
MCRLTIWFVFFVVSLKLMHNGCSPVREVAHTSTIPRTN